MSLDSWTSDGSVQPTDAWLWRVLQKEKNREMIALLEDTLQSFVDDTQQTALTFPPRNAFHRRVCYAVARRYGLEHRLERTDEPSPNALPDIDSLRLVLLKTPHSAPPSDRLAEFADGPPPSPPRSNTPVIARPTTPPEDTITRPATFLKRPTTADGKPAPPPAPNVSCNPTPSNGSALKNMSEEDYQKARARIFKVPTSHPADDTSAESAPQALASSLARLVKVGPIAKGPVEGAAGFERRRTRQAATPSSSDIMTKPGSPEHATADVESSTSTSASTTISTPAASSPARSGQPRRSASTPDCSQGDLQDPDFDRSYVKWARRDPVPPTSQPMPMHLFSGLLYPYALQPPAGPSVPVPAPLHSHHAQHARLHPTSGAPLSSPASMGYGTLPVGVSHNHRSPHAHHVHSHGHSLPAAPHAHLDPRTRPMTSGVLFPIVPQHGPPHTSDFVGGRNPVSRTSAGPGTHPVPPIHRPGDRGAARYDVAPAGADAFVAAGVGEAQSRQLGPHVRPHPIPTRVGRRPSPAYGLDSTVDFPPLP